MTRTSQATLVALTALALNACVISSGDSRLTLDNQSDFAIYQAYLAEVNQPSWGPELLQGSVLYPGDSLEIHSVDCGTYDVLVYDQFGASCELNNLDLCFDDALWVITNSTLATCAIFQ